MWRTPPRGWKHRPDAVASEVERLATQSRAPRVFISYAHKDGRDLAFQLQKDLRGKGFSVWLDEARIKGGASWSVEIEKALDQSDVVLALMSAASFSSDGLLSKLAGVEARG